MNDYISSLLSILPGHIYWKDKNGCYLGCNLAQALSLGFTSQNEMIGKTDFDLSPYEIANEIVAIDREVMMKGIAKTEEELVAKPDGNVAVMLSTKTPMLNEQGEIVGIVGVSIDITKEKAAEKLRIEKEVAEREAAHLRVFQEVIDMLPAHVYWKNKDGVYLGCNLKQAQSLNAN